MTPIETLKSLSFINADSYVRAIQEVREHIDQQEDKIQAASTLINALTGQDVSFDDEKVALHTAQGVVERVIRQGDAFEPEQAIKDAVANAIKLRDNPAMQWINAQPQPADGVVQPTKTVAGVELIVKDNGKIKKGGKQTALIALFKEHVIGKGVSNGEFVKVIMSELNMSKQGATTYAYNARKAVEAELGHKVDVKMSPKGRKAKV